MNTWIMLRAAGIGAYLMLFASVSWGLIATTSLFGKKVAKATAVSVHQFVATVALVLLGVHLGGLLVDTFQPFKPLDILVPLHSSYRTVASAFGTVAMYATVVVLGSSWIRRHMSTKFWRTLHLLAVPAFTLSMVHGIFAGTDTARPWMWWIYVATGGAVLFLLILRGLTAGMRPSRAARPEGAPVRASAATARPPRPATARRPEHAAARGGHPVVPHGTPVRMPAPGRSPRSATVVRPGLAPASSPTLEADEGDRGTLAEPPNQASTPT